MVGWQMKHRSYEGERPKMLTKAGHRWGFNSFQLKPILYIEIFVQLFLLQMRIGSYLHFISKCISNYGEIIFKRSKIPIAIT